MAQSSLSETTGTQGHLEANQQSTLKIPVTQTGVGLHSGATTNVQILPAPPNTGRIFYRTDLPGRPAILATVAAVKQTLLSTELANGDATVRTVEHLLSALVSLGIDNAYIEVDGPEMPLLDGSARLWAEAIQSAGRVLQSGSRIHRTIDEPIWVREQDAFVAALHAPETRLTYGIDFDLPAIGNQWHSWAPGIHRFETDIAPARTFGLAHQIEYLRSQGLIKGGSLENALVCDRDGWINPPLRFDNEPARHKLLDLIGDLSLLGTLPIAHVVAYKASHQLHVELAKAILTQTSPS
ncbi:MAG: UDP-3-O-acyl-N-acetylglucosamine deacetylase [Leptolyngbyaceae cyanobacterium]